MTEQHEDEIVELWTELTSSGSLDLLYFHKQTYY